MLINIYLGLPSDINPSKGPALMQITDIIRDEHFEPNAMFPMNSEYSLYGNSNFVYMSHCPAKHPDYHEVLRIAVLPSDVLSSLLLEYGIVVQIDLSSLPLPSVPGTDYLIRFNGDNGVEKEAIVTIIDNIWYDNTAINEESEKNGR